jgi:hypothetical protein
MSYLHDLLSVASGGLVSFALSIGGGGWILAAPLLIHVVGVASPYVAMARVRLRSPADATFDLIGHARANDRMASCHGIRCLSGITGATVRLELGKMIDGRKLLLFGGLGLVIPLITRRATPVDIVGPPSEVHWASTCAGVPPNATATPVFYCASVVGIGIYAIATSLATWRRRRERRHRACKRSARRWHSSTVSRSRGLPS